MFAFGQRAAHVAAKDQAMLTRADRLVASGADIRARGNGEGLTLVEMTHGNAAMQEALRSRGAGFFNPVDASNVRVIERREHTGLALESREPLRVGRKGAWGRSINGSRFRTMSPRRT
jgi:hypothetical protein